MLSLERLWEEPPQVGIQRPESPLSLPGKVSVVEQHCIPSCALWARWHVLEQGAKGWLMLKLIES